MNYLKNKKRNLIRLTQGSILISSIAIPTITNTNSASAMFNTLARKTVTSASTTPGVRTLITQFEKISHSSSSKATLKRTTLGSNPGFNYMNPSSTSTLNRPTTSSSSNKQNLMSRLFSKISSSKSSKSPLSSTQQSLLKTPTNEATSSSPTTPKQALLPPGYTQPTNTKSVEQPAPSLPTTTQQSLLPPTSSISTQPRPTTKPPIAPKPNLMSNYQQSLSHQATPSTPESSTTPQQAPPKPKRQNLSNTISVRGFTHPYSDETSSSNPKTQPIYDEISVASGSSTSNINAITSTSPTDDPLYSKPYTYTLKIGEGLDSAYNPYKLSKKQEQILESLIKTSVATIVKNNLPGGLSQNRPITLKFDQESGKYLNQALTSFIMRSAINTLNSIDSQQQ